MSSKEFNEKYAHLLEHRHYGLDIDIPEVVEFLDQCFTVWSKTPFTYSQIKLKFNHARVYTTLDRSINSYMEQRINEIVAEYDKKPKL